jgi:hypothetical protein
MDDTISQGGESIMPKTSFQLDDGWAKAIEKLKGAFGGTNGIDIIRRAIALARIAIRMSGDSGEITLRERDSPPIKLLLTV